MTSETRLRSDRALSASLPVAVYRCRSSGCSIRPRGIWRYPVRPQSAPRRHVGEGRGVDHTGIVDVTIQARTSLQTQSKDTRVRRCMHAQDPDRDPCTCHKVCRSVIVTPPRRPLCRMSCGSVPIRITVYTRRTQHQTTLLPVQICPWGGRHAQKQSLGPAWARTVHMLMQNPRRHGCHTHAVPHAP